MGGGGGLLIRDTFNHDFYEINTYGFNHMGISPSSLLHLHEFNFCFETEVSVTQKQSYIKKLYVD